MCGADDFREESKRVPEGAPQSSGLKVAAGILGVSTVGLLVSTIVLAVQKNTATSAGAASKDCPTEITKADFGENKCAGMRPDWPNSECIVEGMGEQSGANVTKGYNGKKATDVVPITSPYREKGLCPVNVHWHLGTEHYSKGQYDEEGSGPIEFHEGRIGFQCRYYDKEDPRFSTPYDWQWCIGMTVGQTYEVHWPHSAAGECNSPWQYQTPFYDGVFCNLPADAIKGLTRQDVASNVGVQSQSFTVVNDEDYYYPDLFTGMIVDEAQGKGTDMAIYTGSTTGTSRSNEICSPFNPITWQVDRKCHLISASSFDKMCKDMSSQADNLKDDLYAHGSRPLVADEYAADNHVQRKRKGRALL